MKQADEQNVLRHFRPLHVEPKTEAQTTALELTHRIQALGDNFLTDDTPLMSPGLGVDLIQKTLTAFELNHSTPLGEKEFLQCLDEITQSAVRVQQPGYIGHMTSALPNYTPALMYLIACLNQNQVKLETSGGLTVMEKQVLHVFHQLIYGQAMEVYSRVSSDARQSLGTFCSGGTIGNLTALWAFRRMDQSQRTPNQPFANGRIYVSCLGHYSIGKVIDILGFQSQQLLSLPPSWFKERTDLLDQQISRDLNEGLWPFLLIGVAGSTETGSVDRLDLLANLAEKYHCFFHVDAAWGGAFLMSEQRHVFDGIEKADAVVIDGHKQLFVPMGCGMVLFKSTEMLSHVRFHADYVIREGAYDLGQMSIEGSRSANSLILYAHLQRIGRQGLKEVFDRQLALVRIFAEKIDQHELFQLTSSPELNLLTYRYCPLSLQKKLDTGLQQALNSINVLLHKKLRAQGTVFVSRTRLYHRDQVKNSLQGMDVFRVVLANPLTDIHHCERVLQAQCDLVATDEELKTLTRQLNMPFIQSAQQG